MNGRKDLVCMGFCMGHMQGLTDDGLKASKYWLSEKQKHGQFMTNTAGLGEKLMFKTAFLPCQRAISYW